MRLQLIHNPDATANRLHVNPADLDQAENDIEHSVLVRAAPVVGGRANVMEVRADQAVPRGKAACSANTRVNLLANDNDEIVWSTSNRWACKPCCSNRWGGS